MSSIAFMGGDNHVSISSIYAKGMIAGRGTDEVSGVLYSSIFTI